MTALALTITQAGHARFTAAQVDQDIDLSVSHVGLTDAQFVAAPTLTGLPGEFRRLDTLSGEAVGDSVVHMVVRDDAAVGYGIRGFGLFLGDGTLFATYSQADRIAEKSTVNDLHFAIDIAFPDGTVKHLTFGDTNFLVPPATSESAGVAELATQAEVDAGTDGARIVTPRTLAARLGALASTLLEAIGARVPLTRRIDTAGLALGGGDLQTDRTISVPAATADQLRFAAANNVAVTPASFGDLGNVIGPTGSYTLPGGLVVKWGGHRGRSTAEISVPVAFAAAFPTACFRVIPAPFNASGATGDDFFCQLQGEPTPRGFTVKYQSDDANGGLDGFDWIAIGV